jgi:hypothetical protein
MKKLILLSILLVVGLSQNAFGCSCAIVDSPKKDPQKLRESMRKYYLNDFKGALFTGKVLSIEKVKVSDKFGDGSFDHYQNKVTVEVEKYWVGVTQSSMTVYTGADGGGCGVDFEVGESYYFNPNFSNGRYQTGICDYMFDNFRNADESVTKKLNDLLGPAKEFKNATP